MGVFVFYSGLKHGLYLLFYLLIVHLGWLCVTCPLQENGFSVWDFDETYIELWRGKFANCNIKCNIITNLLLVAIEIHHLFWPKCIFDFLGIIYISISIFLYVFYFQEREPKCPTVVAAYNFNPEEDAAKIETAIKTKGKQ